MLTRCDTRTRLTQRECVIATGHHSRTRTRPPQWLSLGPEKENRPRTTASVDPPRRRRRRDQAGEREELIGPPHQRRNPMRTVHPEDAVRSVLEAAARR